MKRFYTKLSLKKTTASLVFFFFFFALFINVNAQVTSVNAIMPPAVVSSTVAFNPGLITGTTVTVTDNGGSYCPDIIYEWQSASDAAFTTNVVTNLAATKDYNPGIISTTTYFRRVVSVNCTQPERFAKSTASGVKITIQ